MARKAPIVAIVGRANVGKSSLFNTVLQRRETIVAREPGTTRDSIFAKASWNSKDFWLVDTAGIKDPEDNFEFTIQEQISQAADAADIIWVVIEANVTITEEDRRVAKMALKTKKPVFLVVNKSDKLPGATKLDYQKLGIKRIFLTSATQNKGIDKLLGEVTDLLPRASIKEAENRIHVAILGRPNVGKSYLFNSLAKKQQAIVADRAGTTRDINRIVVRYHSKEIELMDTAGIRRSGKIRQGIERFSVIRSISAIEQADVCLLLIDVNELNVALDQKIAGMVKEAGKGLIIVVSKWDLLVYQAQPILSQHIKESNQTALTKQEKLKLSRSAGQNIDNVAHKDPFTRDIIAKQIAYHFDFVPWAPLIFTSAKTGQNVAKIFDLVLDIVANRTKTYKTSELNRWLQDTVHSHPPAGLKKRIPTLHYMVHENDNLNPSFKVFGSHTTYLHWSYKRYLERKFRESFDVQGTPIKFWFLEKR